VPVCFALNITEPEDSWGLKQVVQINY
jgi:hypothetical protein